VNKPSVVAMGVVRPPLRPNQKKIQIFFWPWGVAEPPPGAIKPPQTASLGWLKPPLGSTGVAGHPIGGIGWPATPVEPRGGFGHPLGSKKLGLAIGGGQSHPMALGGGSATP
jgi:hypothetical protein